MAARILVVEDDLSLARSIARNLQVRGYEVESSSTVAEAVTALERDCPDLVLLDIELPDGSGWEILRALHAGNCHGTRAIVMSALRPNARLAGEFGCMAVLEKPFPMETVIRLVGESLERLQSESAPETVG